MSKQDYEPFGSEWIKEMNKFPKQSLIDIMLRPALIKNIKIIEALKEITEKKGAYSCDKLTWAQNTIDSMAEIAEIILKEIES